MYSQKIPRILLFLLIMSVFVYFRLQDEKSDSQETPTQETDIQPVDFPSWHKWSQKHDKKKDGVVFYRHDIEYLNMFETKEFEWDEHIPALKITDNAKDSLITCINKIEGVRRVNAWRGNSLKVDANTLAHYKISYLFRQINLNLSVLYIVSLYFIFDFDTTSFKIDTWKNFNKNTKYKDISESRFEAIFNPNVVNDKYTQEQSHPFVAMPGFIYLAGVENHENLNVADVGQKESFYKYSISTKIYKKQEEKFLDLKISVQRENEIFLEGSASVEGKEYTMIICPKQNLVAFVNIESTSSKFMYEYVRGSLMEEE